VVETASALGNKDQGKVETAVGDLVADAVREALHTDLAFIAASELKSKDEPIPAGKVASTAISSLVSYPNDRLAVLSLTGKAIQLALERSVSIYPQPSLGFLQVSGLRFTYDASKPLGNRVSSVMVGSTPLTDDARYSVAVTKSMANGALGYWKVWTQDSIKPGATDTTIVKAVEAYFKSTQKIDYGTLNRIAATPK
jgi:2',3'-cyclic-nucleotide 2'-phosphodiesterase (5'-nucleotidase family)